MRHLAITGMETAAIISRIFFGAAIRATPPSARICTGSFGDGGLLGVGDVHDDAAFEHLGQSGFQTQADWASVVLHEIFSPPLFVLERHQEFASRLRKRQIPRSARNDKGKNVPIRLTSDWTC